MTVGLTARTGARMLLGGFLVYMGLAHLFWARRGFQIAVPDWATRPSGLDKDAIVVASGVVEIMLGGALIALPRERRTVGALTAAFFVAVFPGNVHHWRTGRSAPLLRTDRARFNRLFSSRSSSGGRCGPRGHGRKRRLRRYVRAGPGAGEADQHHHVVTIRKRALRTKGTVTGLRDGGCLLARSRSDVRGVGCGREEFAESLGVPAVVADGADSSVGDGDELDVLVCEGTPVAGSGGRGHDRDAVIAGEHVDDLEPVVLDDGLAFEEVGDHVVRAGVRAPVALISRLPPLHVSREAVTDTVDVTLHECPVQLLHDFDVRRHVSSSGKLNDVRLSFMDDPVKSADRSPRAKREWHRGITRDSVANAAVALLDREGRKALTMRRLAQDLDVTAASLYFHVAGKDDLIELVVERVLDGVRLPPSPDLVAAFVAYRRALLDHSEAALLILEFPRLTQASARLTERSLTLLTDSGMPLREATDRHVTAVAYMLGWVLQELMPRKIAPGLAIDSPLVREAMSDLGRRETEDRFVIGLRLILGT